MAPQRKRARQAVILLLKTLASLALCYILISKVGIQQIARNLVSVQPTAFVIAVGLYVALIATQAATPWPIEGLEINVVQTGDQLSLDVGVWVRRSTCPPCRR